MSKLIVIVAVLTALAGVYMDELHKDLGRRVKSSLPAELNNGNVHEDNEFSISLCSVCHRLTNRQEVSQ